MNGSALFAAPQSVTSPPVSRDAAAFSLKQEKVLQKPITIDATDLPLGDLLKQLSQQSDVSLLTIPKTEDQRVTLHLAAQPLSLVMTRLCGLLSHSPSTPHGYFWTKESPPNAPHPRYRLERDLRSRTEEQEALDIPRQKAIAQLRDMRNFSRMSAEQRKSYKGDLTSDYLDSPEMQPFRDALIDASDTQIDTLVQSGSLPLDPDRFAERIANFNKAWHAREIQYQQILLQQGGTDPYPNGVPEAPPDPPTVTFDVDDYGGEHPERTAIYGLALHGVQTLASATDTGSMHVTFSPLRKRKAPFPEGALPGQPIIDLTPLLKGPGVTPEQRGDIGFTLQVLAQASGISLYQEAFPKTIYWGARSQGLKVLKGTVPQLLNAICAEWDYDAAKVGEDYILWSNTWAQDRTYDVPERLLVRWRDRYQKQNGFTLNDRIEMASMLSWPQLFLSLKMLLPEAGPWNSRREAEILCFIAGFSATERTVMADRGLPIASMSPVQQAALLNEMRRQVDAARQTDIPQALLFLTPDPKWQAEGMKRELLAVKSDAGDMLWYNYLFYQAKKEKGGRPLIWDAQGYLFSA